MTNTAETRTARHEADRARVLAAFAAEIDQIKALTARIEAAADDHLGYAADEITWGHQGSAADIRHRLEEIVRILDAAHQELRDAEAAAEEARA